MILARLRAIPRAEATIIVLAVAVLVAFASWKKAANAPPPVASYSSYDTAGGGARAFYEMLAREGVPVERFERTPAFLDGTIDTLVWIEPLPFDPRQQAPTKADIAALKDWVRAGGHFLYAGSDNAAAKAGVLHLPRAVAAGRKLGPPVVAASLAGLGVRSIDSKGKLRWSAGRATILVSDARGPLVVRYGFGRGTVTAVVDEDLFSNTGIGTGDRARLGYLLATSFARGTVAFDETTHGYEVPPHWWDVMPRALVVAIIVALLAIAIACIGAAVRFGPPIQPVTRDDANSGDFIAALAGLLARGGAQRDALVAAADSTTRALARAFGLDDRATNGEIAAHIERADLRAEYAAMLAVAHNGYPNDLNVLRGVAFAQRLRKEYASYADRR